MQEGITINLQCCPACKRVLELAKKDSWNRESVIKELIKEGWEPPVIAQDSENIASVNNRSNKLIRAIISFFGFKKELIIDELCNSLTFCVPYSLYGSPNENFDCHRLAEKFEFYLERTQETENEIIAYYYCG